MLVLRSIDALAGIERPVVLAAGVFDGMHLGHQAVLSTALEQARRTDGTAVALTFDPHPASILRPDAPQRILSSTELKLRLMSDLGIAAALVVEFTPAFAATGAEEFIRNLAASPKKLAGICVGEGWRFGHARRGDANLLHTLGAELGFSTTAVEPVRIGGAVVSSTAIRASLEKGDLASVSQFLGRNYSIPGTVLKGRGMGRQLGFPTANIGNHGEQFPPDGVYAVRAILDGQEIGGVANIGVRPTVTDSRERVLEVHLFDFSADIYGRSIEIAFLHYLRPEKKFPDPGELRRAIEADARSARSLLSERRAA
jgi:riboflavin kinase/FMN adenylyltransferase